MNPKTKSIPLRLTLDEAEKIETMAQSDMRTTANYIRKIVVEHIGGFYDKESGKKAEKKVN